MTRQYSLRARSVLMLLGFALLPALLLTGLLLQAYVEGARVRVQNSLGAVADALALASDSRIQTQLRGVDLSARLPWDRFDTETADARLRLLLREQADVQVALVADRQGRIVALQREGANVDDLRSRIGASVADRDYFRETLRRRAPYVSDVFIGRGLWSEAVVALSAPALDVAGEALGVVQVSLDLRLLGEALAQRLDRGRLGLVLDRQGRVVFASESLDLKPGDSLAGSAFAGIVDAGTDAQLLELDHAGHRYFAQGRRSTTGWQAWALLPREALDTVVMQAMDVVVPVLVLSLAGAWWAASRGAAWLTRPVRALARRIASVQPGTPGQSTAAPPTVLPRELQPIAAELEALGAREREAFARLDASLREREHEIERRTAALRRAVVALRDESRTDSLTGVGNYRAYRQALEEAWQRIAGTSGWMAVLLIDIDHFKQYNDSYGHPAGDLCLRRIAELLQDAAQACGAQLARSGGEEFAMVVVGQPADALVAHARELLTKVEALALPHARSPFGHVTLSAGLAWGGWQVGAGPEEIIAAADRALYAAKHAGRNRLELAPGPLPPLEPGSEA